jgi:hypothetical protein
VTTGAVDTSGKFAAIVNNTSSAPLAANTVPLQIF